MSSASERARKIIDQVSKPTEHGRYAEAGYNDHFNDGLEAAFDALEEAGFFNDEPTTEQFVRWADRSKAVTWVGKLGLKERWLNRDNPEYQQMLRDRKEKPNAV